MEMIKRLLMPDTSSKICVLFANLSFRYVTWWDKLRVSHSKIFFLDEIGFSVSTRRKKGWVRKGTSAYSVCPVIRSKNTSALAVISIMGSFFYEIKDPAYNTTDFCAFIMILFDKFDQKGISYAVIIMDNVSFHKSDAIRSLFDTNEYTIQFSHHIHHFSIQSRMSFLFGSHPFKILQSTESMSSTTELKLRPKTSRATKLKIATFTPRITSI
eukprot:TRINITY_DN111_c0_g1_i3.p1 TRINITY_DN111_c0_g1~~TRINITY_DN111_c0_g1_i3.p1  ORF type:complete len:213 (+),score=19.04 TRINITY_DN111_c0_g1_i3:586-1224(+)